MSFCWCFLQLASIQWVFSKRLHGTHSQLQKNSQVGTPWLPLSKHTALLAIGKHIYKSAVLLLLWQVGCNFRSDSLIHDCQAHWMHVAGYKMNRFHMFPLIAGDCPVSFLQFTGLELLPARMSQEISKWLVNGLQLTSKWGMLGHLLTLYWFVGTSKWWRSFRADRDLYGKAVLLNDLLWYVMPSLPDGLCWYGSGSELNFRQVHAAIGAWSCLIGHSHVDKIDILICHVDLGLRMIFVAGQWHCARKQRSGFGSVLLCTKTTLGLRNLQYENNQSYCKDMPRLRVCTGFINSYV